MRILFLKSLVFVAMATVLSWGIMANAACPAGQIFESCDGVYAGPGPCVPGCIGVPTVPPTPGIVGPSELCFADGCNPVSYAWLGNLVVAESRLPNSYPVMGWSGPCLELNQQCPDILNQAFADLRMNALRANRAQRYE